MAEEIAPDNGAPAQVTSENARFAFYDIEVLSNAFTNCVYDRTNNHINVFYLVDADGSTLDTHINQQGLDVERAWKTITESNLAWKDTGHRERTISFHDLREFGSNAAMAMLFGLSDADSVNDPSSASTYTDALRPVCDTDPDYDPVNAHPYLTGYNSFNYDTTMLAIYFMEAFAHLGRAVAEGQDYSQGFVPPTCAGLRQHNDRLFDAEFISYMPNYLVRGEVAGDQGWNSPPSKIRRAWMHSGRHLDAARFNELQQKVGLKRLLGGMGRQIKESDKLGQHNSTVETPEDFYELLAYNVSDVVGLSLLFDQPAYSNNFDLKKGLLDEYPETVYQKKPGAYAPDIAPNRVRRDRLAPDSSSAKLVSFILSPYGHLDDIEAVSFLYPSEKVAAERGITRMDVLEYARQFFYDSVEDPDARARFDAVYGYYDSIRGKNFNDSEEYSQVWPSTGFDPDTGEAITYNHRYPHVLREIPKAPNNLPYYHADGTPSSCFVTFSTGGIHGAEADWHVYGQELEAWEERAHLMNEVRALHPDPLEVRTAKEVELADGTVIPYKDLLTSKSTIKALTARSEAIAALGPDPDPQAVAAVDEQFKGIGYKPTPPRPELFTTSPDGSTKLGTKYNYTSAEKAIHEDFTSYYPNMLRNMSAFYNPQLGTDRYAKIFFDKERLGQEMKNPAISSEEKKRLGVLRNGTKLILNTASGAGDTLHYNPIRMNNTIISMRIIGQLFSWIIGQAQTLAGARIISTNTDGLYSVLDAETNNRVLAEQSAKIGVDIEPEDLMIVSKDSNNRLEMALKSTKDLEKIESQDERARIQALIDADVWDYETTKVVAAGGGSLACYEEPQPTKSLAHPAVLDRALSQYLHLVVTGHRPDHREQPLSLEEPMDPIIARQLLAKVVREEEPVLAARLFQNVIAASSGKLVFPFAADPVDPYAAQKKERTITGARGLQHYNRVFVVHHGKPGAVSLQAACAKVVSPASRLKRAKDGDSASTVTDPVARQILHHNGLTRKRAEASSKGMKLIPEDQDVAVRRISGVDPSWSMLIVNEDLHEMDDHALRDLLGCLDLDVYAQMLMETYEKNWKNPARD